jgi:hypothetical protein
MVAPFLARVCPLRDNPKKPLAKNAGRVLKLTEVMRIEGEGEDYYYNGANELQIDDEGNIYIRDAWSSNQRAHLPKFSPDGRFLLDLYRQGEGPGEIESAYDFDISGSRVFVFDYMKRKILTLESDGTFVEEFKLESETVGELIGLFKGQLVFLRQIHPFERKTSRLYDVENIITFIAQDGRTEKDVVAFLNKQFYISSAQGGGLMFWDPFISVMGDGKLFVCSSQEYIIQVLDLETEEVTAKWTRDYSRIKHELLDWERQFISKFKAPRRRFEPDIKALFYNRGDLWVQTSRQQKDRGILFDVFDSEGRFVDSFYIPLEGRIVKIDGDFLFCAETDEEYLPCVVKYRIDG